MWMISSYRPVGLFSLKMGQATSTGAKTLFLPTPFAIRTALLDATIRSEGLAMGPETFEIVKGLAIAARPPERVVVTNLFMKVLKPQRADAQRAEAMQSTIAFREYAYLAGELELAFEGDETPLCHLEGLLPQINYFGKRGCFFQLLALPKRVQALPERFVALRGLAVSHSGTTEEGATAFALGVIQMLDDWGPHLTFEKVNIYSDESIRLGRDRIRQGVILPYRLVRSSRSFSYYERI
jgi:hypothetical protein